ncbi:MAG: transglycosylase domain-containing protein, partial [Lachnospiraceae bacterium]|nr:transglycosylase domain-containing protein [Lachnospiraceae bacterium]
MTGSKIRTFFRVMLVALLAVIAAGAVFAAYCIVRAPSISVLDAKPHGYRSNVLDKDGNVVLTLSGEESNRVYVKLSEVPESLQEAVVAIEDERFYEHFGIDPKGIARALYRGITEGNFSEGASTITQQLLKNNVFTDWMNETTFLQKVERKIQEQYLAVALEMHVNKDWILENYLNTINLGGGNWGVETAAKYYFDKNVSDLTLSESAVLAGITRNPTRYNPITNPEANAERREYILDKMLSLGYITQEERDEAAADDVYARISDISTNGGTQEVMTYFEDAMIYSVLHDLMSEKGC